MTLLVWRQYRLQAAIARALLAAFAAVLTSSRFRWVPVALPLVTCAGIFMLLTGVPPDLGNTFAHT